jgi:hypothetical protein
VSTTDGREAVNEQLAKDFLGRIDGLMEEEFRRMYTSQLWKLLSNPNTAPSIRSRILQGLMLQSFFYGPHVTAATFTAIGRLPHTDSWLLKACTKQLLDETTHPEMALHDYVQLGGDEKEARERDLSPTAFAVAATCRLLAEHKNRFAFLGYVYFLETSTSRLTKAVSEMLNGQGLAAEVRTFVDLHAVEDDAHAALVARAIGYCAANYSDAAKGIEFGFRCFAAVYPLPIWEAVAQEISAN